MKGVEKPVKSLDEGDRAVLLVLRADGRASLREIAEQCGMSESAARTRVARLFDDGVVAVHGIAHPTAFGESVVLYTYLHDAPDDSLVQQTQPLDRAAWLASLTGSRTVVAQLVAGSIHQIPAVLESLAAIEGVSRVECVIALAVHTGPLPRHWESGATGRMDALDRTLTWLLVAHGRASFAEIARAASIPVPTARRRVLRLLESGVVQLRTFVREGGHDSARQLLRLAVSGPRTHELIAAITSLEGTEYVTETTGEYSLACLLVASSTVELTALVDRILALDGVAEHLAEPFTLLSRAPSWPSTSKPQDFDRINSL